MMGLALDIIKKYDKSMRDFVNDQHEYNQQLVDDMNRMIQETARMPKGLKIVKYKI